MTDQQRFAAPTPDAWSRVERGVRRIERWKDPNADDIGRQRAVTPIETVFFRNDSTETIPPFGLIRVTGIELVGTDEPLLVVAKPNGQGLNVFANDGQPVAPEGIGTIQTGERWIVLIDKDEDASKLNAAESTTPEFGYTYGDQNDSFKASKYGTGLVLVSRVKGPNIGTEDAVDPNGYANYHLFKPVENPLVYAKATASIAASATGTIRPYGVDFTDAVARSPVTKTDRPARNLSGVEVTSTPRLFIMKDAALMEWVILQAFICSE